MTTGRINQVTIVTPRQGPEGHTESASPPEENRNSCTRRAGTKVTDRPPGIHNSEVVAPGNHPIAPTEFPKAWSATEFQSVPVKGLHHETATYTPQEEDTARRSRQAPQGPPTVTDHGLPPKCLVKISSQRPTIHRPHRARKAKSLSEFSCLPLHGSAHN